MIDLTYKYYYIKCDKCRGNSTKLKLDKANLVIERCDACNGTGRKAVESRLLKNCQFPCTACKATGFVIGKHKLEECKECSGKGFRDWIDNILK